MLNLLRAFRPIASDFLSTIVFIIAVEVQSDVRIAIAAGIATGIVQFGYLLLRRKPIAAMQWMSLFLVITLGGASLITADPRFVMIKPSIGAFAIAAVMLKKGWMSRYMPDFVLEHIPPSLPIIWGYVWSAAIFLLGVANLVVALSFGLKTWAVYSAFVPISVQLGLFLLQYFMMRITIMRNIRAAQAAA